MLEVTNGSHAARHVLDEARHRLVDVFVATLPRWATGRLLTRQSS